MCHKKKLKFQDYKNCLQAAQIKNKPFRKKKLDVESLTENQTEFIKNKLILKTQQRCKSERHNAFTEEINKIALSSNNHKRMQSIDSTETY